MVRYENQCVGCPPEMGCLGNSCRYRNVPIWVCDDCGEEDVDLYEYEGREICKDCLLEAVPKIHYE